MFFEKTKHFQAFDLFFPVDGGTDVCELFVEEKAVAVVLAGEGGLDVVAMFEEALIEVAGDTCVEGSGGAAENIDVVLGHAVCGRKARRVWVREGYRDPSLCLG